MRIGIDFDNTIACYDGVFYTAALERGLIPAGFPTSKNAVRDHLNGSGRKDDFTWLQGHVYGKRMDLASLYPGLLDFLARSRSRDDRAFIVSHKTRHPLIGPPHDMHAAARRFLAENEVTGPSSVSDRDVYFELTKEAKIDRVRELGCDLFIDDLPEILSMPGLPRTMRRILFDPSASHALSALEPAIECCASWAEISRRVFGDGDV